MLVQTVIYFLDVGQGTSQVLHFNDSSVVIIDCGKSAEPVLSLLDKLSFTRIAAIAISHWHEDHVGGLAAILDQYANKVQSIHFPQTEPAESLLKNKSLLRLRTCLNANPHIKVDILNCGGRDPILYSCSKANVAIRISCVFPSFLHSLDLQTQSDKNAGSGVFLFECGDNKVLFPGDVGVKGLLSIHRDAARNNILRCSVCAAPHHTGRLSNEPDADDEITDVYAWLYEKIIRPEILIVSVGTNNSHGHPKKEHIRAAVRKGVTVLCTQITSQCCANPTNFAPAIHKDCSTYSCCSRGFGVGCIGSIQVEFGEAGFEVLGLHEHQRAVDRLQENDTPLCRIK